MDDLAVPLRPTTHHDPAGMLKETRCKAADCAPGYRKPTSSKLICPANWGAGRPCRLGLGRMVVHLRDLAIDMRSFDVLKQLAKLISGLADAAADIMKAISCPR